MAHWRRQLAAGAILLALVTGVVRLAYWFLAPAAPLLIVGGALAAIYLLVLRRPR